MYLRTSLGSLLLSSRDIFLSFMSDQNMVPVCMFDAVATTFSTIIGTRSRPCSLRSATSIEWRLEIIRNAALWSKENKNQAQHINSDIRNDYNNSYINVRQSYSSLCRCVCRVLKDNPEHTNRNNFLWCSYSVASKDQAGHTRSGPYIRT